MFELHPRLAVDTVAVGDFPLCRLLLHRDANYPWFILVPRREEITEIYHLSEEDRQQLTRESCLLAEALVDVFSPDKINIATLGNMVPQLHMHHVVRYHADGAWPSPIWGALPPLRYSDELLHHRVESIANVLEGPDFTPGAD
ncbi:HIT domain-containing protein [Porticoccus sp.]